MTISHIVSIAFADDISQQHKDDIFTHFLSLKKACQRDGKSYIVELIGGKENSSPEGAGKHYDHSYIVTFANLTDRDYYLDKDPAHAEFKSKAQKLLKDAYIYDFEH